jgi:flagellar biosynthesis protein FlhG
MMSLFEGSMRSHLCPHILTGSPEDALEEIFTDDSFRGRAERMRLAPLPEDAAFSMFSHLCDGAGIKIYDTCRGFMKHLEGNPLYIRNMVRALRRMGRQEVTAKAFWECYAYEVSEGETAFYWSSVLRGSLGEADLRRLGMEVLRRSLELPLEIGDIGRLSRVIGMPESSARDVLDALQASGMVRTAGGVRPVEDTVLQDFIRSSHMLEVKGSGPEKTREVIMQRRYIPDESIRVMPVKEPRPARPAMDKQTRTITVASGKGGVGKTNVVANLAIALSKMGHKVLVFDADLGLSNIDVVLDLRTKYNIQHVLEGQKSLREVIVEGPYGIKVLPAASGVQEITELDRQQRARLLEELDSLDMDIDYLIVDSAAGISSNVAFFCAASEEIIMMTSPEPTALTDAYALIKVLSTWYGKKKFMVLVNFVGDEAEGKEVFMKLHKVSMRFLNVPLDYLGCIPDDEAVRKAVRHQKAVIERYPYSEASRSLQKMAARIVSRKEERVKGSLQHFFGTLLGQEADARQYLLKINRKTTFTF